MKIVLIGYMGSGKSTVGRKLAQKRNCKFIDLDDYIEQKEETTIANIFKNKGEIYFRRLETASLEELMNTSEAFVLSLGGGTPCFSGNMELIAAAKETQSVYLALTPQTLASRLINEKAQRPLISHLEDLEALVSFIGVHLFERQPFYRKAQISLPTDTLNPDETVEKIIEILD